MNTFIDKFIDFNDHIIKITLVTFAVLAIFLVYTITTIKIEKTVELIGKIETQDNLYIY